MNARYQKRDNLWEHLTSGGEASIPVQGNNCQLMLSGALNRPYLGLISALWFPNGAKQKAGIDGLSVSRGFSVDIGCGIARLRLLSLREWTSVVTRIRTRQHVEGSQKSDDHRCKEEYSGTDSVSLNAFNVPRSKANDE